MKRHLFMRNLWIMGCMMFAAGTQAQTVNNPFGNALIPDMNADASIQIIDDTFYCYATTDGYGQGLKTSGPPVVWKSKDFVNWYFEGTYFPSAVKEKYWAPSKAVKVNGKYYIYPTINGYMYPAVADSPDGPFRLAKGKDEFYKPFTSSVLLPGSDPSGIDAEIFIDDDGQAYVFWGRRHVAKLKADMASIDSAVTVIDTPHTAYSEGPIFFKRNGIYYYLYTLGGNEQYRYAYVMSRESPLGPYVAPENDIVAQSCEHTGVLGPGHGCVFNDGDQYYFAFLEFGRGGTNRQTFVNRMYFNEDGTIQPVEVNLNGVGALRKHKKNKILPVKTVTASSVKAAEFIRPISNKTSNRTEYFVPQFIIDQSNGSRWMAADDDKTPSVTIDLGKKRRIKKSDLYFVRPTAGHTYKLEASDNGKTWRQCGGNDTKVMKSPHTDKLNIKARYLRVTITDGIAGLWEWKLY